MPAGKGLPKRELRRLQRQWRDCVREIIKRLPVPEGATPGDYCALFDAVLSEVEMGRKIIAYVRDAKPLTVKTTTAPPRQRHRRTPKDVEAEAWLRRQLEGLGGPS